MIISVSGKEYGSGWIGADKTIDYEATGLSSDEYVDIAIQVTLLERRFNTRTNSFINISSINDYNKYKHLYVCSTQTSIYTRSQSNLQMFPNRSLVSSLLNDLQTLVSF